MEKFIYKCSYCGTDKKFKSKRKSFKCKSCGKYSEAIIVSIPHELPETEKNIIQLEKELKGIESKKINLAIENIDTDVRDLTAIPETSETGNIIELPEQDKIVFSNSTIQKYISMLDKMMLSKDGEWIIEEQQEATLAEFWADFANESFNTLSKKQSKLAIASLSTVTVYLPHIIRYVKKAIDEKKRGKGQNGISRNIADTPVNSDTVSDSGRISALDSGQEARQDNGRYQ